MSKKILITIGVVILVIAIILCMCVGSILVIGSSFSNMETGAQSTQYTQKVLVDGGNDKIAVIDVKGEIMDSQTGGGFFESSFASSDTIISQLDEAQKDDSVKAIVLNIDTPGGGVYPSELIYQKIKEVQSTGKPVIALQRGLAASGGYYISAPADRIIANEVTITGSIGVLIQAQNLDGLYDKLGVKTITITNVGGEEKTDKGLFDANPNGETEKIYQDLVDEAYDRFISIIAEGRDMEIVEVKKLADGRIYSGKQALELGLVDKLGNFDTAIDEAKTLANIDDPTVIQYEQSDFFSLLTGAISSTVNPAVELQKMLDVSPGVRLEYRMP